VPRAPRRGTRNRLLRVRAAVDSPLIPFLAKLRSIGETDETGPEIGKSLESRINTGYSSQVSVSPQVAGKGVNRIPPSPPESSPSGPCVVPSHHWIVLFLGQLRSSAEHSATVSGPSATDDFSHLGSLVPDKRVALHVRFEGGLREEIRFHSGLPNTLKLSPVRATR